MSHRIIPHKNTSSKKKPINKPQLLIRLTEWAKHPVHRYETDAGHPCFPAIVTSSSVTNFELMAKKEGLITTY